MSKSVNSGKPSDRKWPDARPDARGSVRRTDGGREAEAVPSNTAINKCNPVSDAEVKFLRWGVDSLYLSYAGELSQAVDNQLKALKQVAQSEQVKEQSSAQFKVGEHLFEVKDKGASFFAYILEDNAFRIQLSRPGKAVPMAYVKISSEYLTHRSPEDAEKSLRAVLSQLGELNEEASVSRIDLFADFVSWVDMESWKREAWVTHAEKISSYAVDNHFTGWAVGLGGVIGARLYDKLCEIMTSNKAYLVPLWQQAGWEAGEPIWRLEFEFKRQFLTQKGLSKLSQVLAHRNGLWSYATTEWLRLTIPNPEDKTRSRWPLHPLWIALASVDWEANGGPLSNRFNNNRSPDASVALDRAFSALTSWMAICSVRDFEQAKQPFISALNHFINNKAIGLGLSFDGLISEKVNFKARQFNTLDNRVDTSEADLEESVRLYREASGG